MSYKISEIEGIGPLYAAKLSRMRIETTDDLLAICADPRGRKTLTSRTGISPRLLLRWANMADLMRINGIGRQYAELLEAAGVDTVKELRHRDPEALTETLREVNRAKKLAKNAPPLSLVKSWIEQARAIEPRITH